MTNDEVRKKWEALTLRLQSEVRTTLKTDTLRNNHGGIAIVTVRVICDADGIPQAWIVEPGKRIEPSSRAAEVLKKILSNLVGEDI